MRSLVIGADGFAGRWLVRHLVDMGDVVGCVVGPRYKVPIAESEDVVQLDVRDASALSCAVERFRPDWAFYLAAVSERGIRDDLRLAAGVGVVGVVNTIVACAALQKPSTVVHVSSSHVYARGHSSPIDESAHVHPTSVYGAAKAASEAAVVHLGNAAGVPTVVARPFNHAGPGQSEHFLLPSLARRAIALRTAGNGALTIESGDAILDITDVRDVVTAYRTLAERGESGTAYNVCSGNPVAIRQLANLMLDAVGVTADVVFRESARAGTDEMLVGDPSRVRSLGWRPERDLVQTIRDVVAELEATA